MSRSEWSTDTPPENPGNPGGRDVLERGWTTSLLTLGFRKVRGQSVLRPFRRKDPLRSPTDYKCSFLACWGKKDSSDKISAVLSVWNSHNSTEPFFSVPIRPLCFLWKKTKSKINPGRTKTCEDWSVSKFMSNRSCFCQRWLKNVR